MGSVDGIDGLAAQETPADFTGHAWVGTWMATTPGGLAPGYFAADGSVVMGLQATQVGPMGVAFVSSEVGRWEPVDERTAHFTAVQILSDADGQFLGTITIDGYPVVNDDGQSFIDDGSQGERDDPGRVTTRSSRRSPSHRRSPVSAWRWEHRGSRNGDASKPPRRRRNKQHIPKRAS